MWFPAVEADMGTSEAECLETLREAADRLGESPTKAEYEDLGLTPASATIIRVEHGADAEPASAAPFLGQRVQANPGLPAL